VDADGYFDERVAARYDESAAELLSMPFRYAWPAELDLMAQLAEMSLRARWSGWKQEPFTSASRMHVSVWEKPPA